MWVDLLPGGSICFLMNADEAKFFASPTKRKSKSNDQPDRSPSATSSDPEVIDLAQLEEEEQVEEEMGEGDFMPPEGIGDPEAKPSSTLRKRKDSCEAPATKSRLLGPICPICAQALGPSTSNQGLNDHIDWCLNKGAISTASKRIPKAKVSAGEDTAKRKGSGNDTAKKKGESKGSMMCWLKKEM